jgi:hypothetical protein
MPFGTTATGWLNPCSRIASASDVAVACQQVTDRSEGPCTAFHATSFAKP